MVWKKFCAAVNYCNLRKKLPEAYFQSKKYAKIFWPVSCWLCSKRPLTPSFHMTVFFMLAAIMYTIESQ